MARIEKLSKPSFNFLATGTASLPEANPVAATPALAVATVLKKVLRSVRIGFICFFYSGFGLKADIYCS
jgi:hypothetical protein